MYMTYESTRCLAPFARSDFTVISINEFSKLKEPMYLVWKVLSVRSLPLT